MGWARGACVSDVCFSGAALGLVGALGGILLTGLTWGVKGYVAALVQRGDDWKALAERSTGQTREVAEIAKGRR